jgi:hypothetical protein
MVIIELDLSVFHSEGVHFGMSPADVNMRQLLLILLLYIHNKLKGTNPIPPGPLINGLKPFCIWLRIREDIRQSRCSSGVNDTAGA